MPETTANYINDLENFIDAVQDHADYMLQKHYEGIYKTMLAAAPQEGE